MRAHHGKVIPMHGQAAPAYEQMAPHMPIDQYRAQQAPVPAQHGHAPVAHGCGCGHGGAPMQPIIIKQEPDKWARYMAIGFAGAGIAMAFVVSLTVLLIAGALCALCVAVAVKAVRHFFDKGEAVKGK